GGQANGIEALTAALKGDNPTLVQRAIAVVGEMASKARGAAPRLRELMTSKDAAIRVAAAEALYRVTGNPMEALPTLAAESASKEKVQRRAATDALGKLAGDARAAVLLESLLTDQDADIRREAAAAFSAAGGSRATLERGLRDKDLGVRWW